MAKLSTSTVMAKLSTSTVMAKLSTSTLKKLCQPVESSKYILLVSPETKLQNKTAWK